MWLLTETLSAFCWVIYGSFFEWFFHKCWMHHPRPPHEAFRGHTIVHHGIYKGNEKFFSPEDAHSEHILLKPYALPVIFLIHLPPVYLIDRYLVHNTAQGAMLASLVYFVIYEYMHWNMHVPRHHWVERFKWFQFLRSHHHLHHRVMGKNFCVLLPLADYVMGTMETEESLARRKAERERLIAAGQPVSASRRRRPGRHDGRHGLSRFTGLSLGRVRFRGQRLRAGRGQGAAPQPGAKR